MTHKRNTTGLRRGNPGGSGGGRPKDKFTKWCQKTVSSPAAKKFVRDLIDGAPIDEQRVEIDGEEHTIKVSAPASARLKALEIAMAYAFGKPAQSLEVAGADSGPIKFEIINFQNGKWQKS